LVILSLFQIMRIIYHRHNIFHYQFGFLFFCFIWGVLRVSFLPFVYWPPIIENALNGAAIVIQFSTFSFVVLFYAQMVHRYTFQFLSKVVIICFFAINLIILGVFIGICLIVSTQLETFQAILYGCAYVLLSVAILFYGWKLKYLIFSKNVKVPFLKHRYSLLILTLLLSFIFTLRAIWNFILAVQFNNLSISLVPIIYYGCPCPKLIDQLITSSLLILWDIIPSAVMIGIFWKIPKSKSPHSSTRAKPPTTRTQQYYPVPSVPSNLVSIEITDSVQSGFRLGEAFSPSPPTLVMMTNERLEEEENQNVLSIQVSPPGSGTLSRSNSKRVRAGSLKISKGSPFYD